MHSARAACELFLLLAAITSGSSSKCNRLLESVTTPRSSAEGKYHVLLTLFNRTEIAYAYMPNTRYSVTIQADATGPMPHRFTRFLISSEPENANETTDSGVFDLQDESFTKFVENCANSVSETSKVPKEEVSVAWTSPSEGSGCVFIRATIFETSDTWYMDDPSLVLHVCQDSKAEADDQGPVLPECWACDEAKYEVTFEGLWSRNTHPKDFPSKGWLIRFSDVIGASHTVDYRFWRYNGMASTGLRQVAELGSTRKLESELKDQSEHIRTIIKARGISYPNVTGRTFAVFRVDRKHHLMSLVSMIDPSPDWIVGVSGLELCLSNSSWIEHKELNLYPYDAGTDDGITYLSPDAPSNPQEPIRRITSTYPNDSRSPFYDPSGLDMKPLARLYLNRQRLYEKTCDDLPGETVDPGVAPAKVSKNKACRVSPWGEWSDCSVTCGKGNKLRQRHYLDETAAMLNKCNESLTDRTACKREGSHCGGGGRSTGILNDERCSVGAWSSWSECTTTCGPGSKTRSRNFRHKQHRKHCKAEPDGPDLQQTIDCDNDPCPGEDGEEVREPLSHEGHNEDEDEDDVVGGEDYVAEEAEMEVTEEWLQKCPKERYTQWSMWSPCSSSCGPGVHLRSRLVNKNWNSLGNEEEDDSLEECKQQQAACTANIRTCDFSKEEAEKICSEPMMKGDCEGNILRAYFDKHTGRCRLFSYSGCNGNRNNFQTGQDCDNVCGNFQKSLQFKGIPSGSQVVESNEQNEERVDCQVSKWSKWSQCEGCRGYTMSRREILVPARGNGRSCPRKLERKRKCHKVPPCSLQGDGPGRRSYRDRDSSGAQNDISVDCKMTQWSSWSRCTATCGDSLQHRTRTVKVQPRGPNGKLCSALVEFRKCLAVDCP
ncbi:hypothetical protein KM043_013767 [Ampulex compressa]|nr:hypothetical protein KM043_013767 [Ampulex compressa]